MTIAADAIARDTAAMQALLEKQRAAFTAELPVSAAVRKDYRESLAPLGPLTAFEPAGKPKLRGGFVNRTFTATFGNTPVANTRNLLIGTTPYNENFLGRLDDVQIVASTLDANGVFGTMRLLDVPPRRQRRIDAGLRLRGVSG